jgi:hypothetical protein
MSIGISLSFASADEAANASSQPCANKTRPTGATSLVLRPNAFSMALARADQEQVQQFISLYDEKHKIEEKVPGRAELVGPDDWPLPYSYH